MSLKKFGLKSTLFLTIMGPGIITALGNNDAGGIATYSIAGAHYGLRLLWILFLTFVAVGVVQEMCARMGVITGKGLSDLIRENFGVRLTFIIMLLLLIVNLTTIMAEFAGIAASLEILGINRYLSVSVIAILLWALILKGSYPYVEKVFLFLCLIFVAYPLCAFFLKPDWQEVIHHTLIPTFNLNLGYLITFVAIIGTTLTPWMQFFLQSSVAEKGIDIKEYKYTKLDVWIGTAIAALIPFFIIICCEATLYKQGVEISTAEEAARALAPIAGKYFGILFALGLFGASMLAAAILPLCTSYAICEAFGFESGISKKFAEAPVFFILYTVLIIIGAITVLIPGISLIKIMLISQVICGISLPLVLIYVLVLINKKELMGEWTNSFSSNVITVIITVIVTIAIILMIFTPLFSNL